MMFSSTSMVIPLMWSFLLLFIAVCGNDNNDVAVTVVEEDDTTDLPNGGPVRVNVDHTGNGDSVDPDVEPFVPTHEWQKVKKGQSVPKGLHVRMNMQTNEIEAKLLDEDDKADEVEREERKRQMVDIQESAAAFNNRDQIRLSRSQIKEVLKNLKHDQDDVRDEKVKEEAVQKKFRSMDELKEDMKQMEMSLQTDSEIIDKLWRTYTSNDVTVEEKLRILHELEYYLHQFDNAQNFAKMGGLEVLNKDLNSTIDDVRREVALVVASAVQSNPGVQIKAIEVGLMHHLIRLIAVERSIAVKSRVLSAAASLIRHFPFAQKKFLQLGGLDALSDLFHKPGLEKLQLKAVTLLGDLLNELNESRHHPDPLIARENMVEKLRQYRDVGLVEALSDQRWCEHIASLLRLPEHDSREKVLATMATVLSICRDHFMQQIQPLEQLRIEYEHLSKTEPNDGDDYFNHMYNTIEKMLIRVKNQKDEL